MSGQPTSAAHPDAWLEEYDVRSSHSIFIKADRARVYQELIEIDLARSPLIRSLFFLRGLPRKALRLAYIEQAGFLKLAEDPGHSFIYGIVGRFWNPLGHLQRMPADSFRQFSESGFAKAVWHFEVVPREGGVDVNTETRVRALDDRSRRRFKSYWFIVGPFSGLIRRESLRLLKKASEQP